MKDINKLAEQSGAGLSFALPEGKSGDLNLIEREDTGFTQVGPSPLRLGIAEGLRRIGDEAGADRILGIEPASLPIFHNPEAHELGERNG